MALSLDQASKVVQGIGIKIDAEYNFWLSQMRITRWVGAIMFNSHSKRTKKPEQLFSLPEDRAKIDELPATKEEVLKAVKKAKKLRQWQQQEA